MRFVLLIASCLIITEQINAQSPAVKAEQMLDYARQYEQEGRLTAALEQVDTAIKMDDSFVDARLLRARILASMDDLKSANIDYSIILYLEPQRSDARFQRAVNYFRMKRHEDASEDFHYLLNNLEGETTTVYFKGRRGANGFTGSGLTTLQSDMRADIYNYLGVIHLSLQNLDSSDFYLNKALLRNSREPDYYVNRALLHVKRKDTTAAIADYQRALSYQSDHAEAMANLYQLSKKGNYQKILAETYELAVSEQGSYEAYFNRAVYYQGRSKHRSAIQDFDRALAMAGADDEALLLRAFSKEHTADLKGALIDYSRALRLNPMLAKAYSNRANVYYKLKKYKEAINDYNRAIEFFPENARLFYNRGLALYQDGQLTDACIDLHISLEMGYTNANAPLRAYCQD